MAWKTRYERPEKDAGKVVSVEDVPLRTDDKRDGVEDHQRPTQQREVSATAIGKQYVKWRLAAIYNEACYNDLLAKYNRMRTFIEGSIGYFTCSPDGMWALKNMLEETKIDIQQTDAVGNRTAGDTR